MPITTTIAALPAANLLAVYTHLIGWTLAGWLLGRVLPQSSPAILGKFLFWIGVPISILGFLRQAQISLSLWIAPVLSLMAVLFGIAAAMGVIGWQKFTSSNPDFWNRRTIGSFLLSSMVGNTGYIGYPVSLALVGPEYFAWALFYDIGSTIGAYGLGVVLAAQLGTGSAHPWRALQAIVVNPALWSFGLGIGFRHLPLPPVVDTGLKGFAWATISLALMLVGMRLSQLKSLRRVRLAAISLGIKMVLVPLVLGIGLLIFGITGSLHRVLLLQMAMPPAFATLVLAEAYELNQNLTVTTLVIGSLGLLVMLPIWLLVFRL